MAINLTKADFHFAGSGGRDIIVHFYDGTVRVWIDGDITEIPNAERPFGGRPWKPCATHALALIRQVMGEPARNGFARRRRRESAPTPRLYQE